MSATLFICTEKQELTLTVKLGGSELPSFISEEERVITKTTHLNDESLTEAMAFIGNESIRSAGDQAVKEHQSA